MGSRRKMTAGKSSLLELKTDCALRRTTPYNCSVGMLYVLSARLNAEGFVFETLIDRFIRRTDDGCAEVFGALPEPLALLFAIEDSASWLWALLTSDADRR